MHIERLRREIEKVDCAYKIICDKSIDLSQAYWNDPKRLELIFGNINNVMKQHFTSRKDGSSMFQLGRQRTRGLSFIGLRKQRNFFAQQDLISETTPELECYIEKVHLYERGVLR